MKIQFNKLFNFLLIFTLMFGAFGQAQAQGQTAPSKSVASRDINALPAGPTDETKVPHYFGPYPNWANSSQVPDFFKCKNVLKPAFTSQ